jgi:hypothetical protein
LARSREDTVTLSELGARPAKASCLKHGGLEAQQTQISQQLAQASIIKWGHRRSYADLDLPSDFDLALRAGLTEAQEANRRFGSIVA